MTSPSEELRTAATALRSLAADATDGPWVSEDPSTRWGDDYDHRLVGAGKILAVFNSDHNGPLNAAYAAAMHPGVGKALALLLDGVRSNALETDHEECSSWCSPETCDLSAALAVARLVNGGEPR
jgi:hypothetical protein